MKVCFDIMQSKVTCLKIAYMFESLYVWHSGSLEVTYIDKTLIVAKASNNISEVVTSFHVKHICENPMSTEPCLNSFRKNVQLFCLNTFLQISVQFMMYSKSPRDTADGDEETAALLQNWTYFHSCCDWMKCWRCFWASHFHSHSWQTKKPLFFP